MEKAAGRVVESLGGFYTVALEGGARVVCRGRGRLKQQGRIVVGDEVEIAYEGSEGVIEAIRPRRSLLERPVVANVDTAVVTMALARPDPALELLDRILARVALEGLDTILVWNKADLVGVEESEAIAGPYRRAGYRCIATSAATGAGVDALREALTGRLAVVAGPSGVGKSSLLNLLSPGANQKTQGVSEKGRRGRHTTRAVSLLPLPGGGWVADAPGFSVLSLGAVDPRRVPSLFPDLEALGNRCRFAGCFHRDEPGCAVKEAVEEGRVDRGRYRRYLAILREVEDAFERRF